MLKKIKREAKKLRKQNQNIKHSQALEIVAREYGFRNYHSAFKALNERMIEEDIDYDKLWYDTSKELD